MGRLRVIEGKVAAYRYQEMIKIY
nr:hypothetical protein [Psychromonas ingrahamii]